MGPQKTRSTRELTFCKKLRARPAAISSKIIKNHQKSSFFEFARIRWPLRDPKTAPRRVPVSAALYRECENGRPEGPPSAQQSGRGAFFLTFPRAKKRRFSHSRYKAGPKIPPGRDPRRPGFPNSIRAEGPLWDPKNGTIGAFSVSQKRIRPAGGDFWGPERRQAPKILQNHHFSNLR